MSLYAASTKTSTILARTDIVERQHFVASLTVGPNLAMQLTRVVQLYARAAPGFSVIDNGVVTFSATLLGGAQFMF